MEVDAVATSETSSFYASIPLLPQLKNYGYSPPTTDEGHDGPPSADRAIGVCVNFEDHGGVWQFLSPSLSQRLPLRGIVWKNHLQSNKTIDRLHVNFQQLASSSSGGHVDTTGLVHMFVVKCEDMDTYKAKVKPSLSAWVDRMTLHGHEWLVLYVPLGTQMPSSTSVARGLGLSALTQTFRDTSKVYRKIFDRMKGDFADNQKSKLDRFCKIDVLDGSSGVPGQQQQHESQWSEVLIKLKACIMDAFDARCAEYEDQLRVLDGKRALSGWDFSSFLQVKESLALLYIQATLYDDALRHYDELEAIYASIDHEASTHVRFNPTDAIFTSTPFEIDMTSVRMNIAVNAASVLHVRLYLFCRQVAILLLMENAYVDVCQRGLVLIPQVVALLHTLRISPAMASQWAVGAALALCVACEHECSRLPSSPALATALGDLLYLARRHAKSLDLCGSSEWYPLQSPQGLDEITQRAAVQYGRAGRVRLASFLAAQRHASWKCADDHDQPSPLLAQLNQYERDQWWDLMHDTVVRFMKAELQRGNVCDVVDVALRWLKLDAAVDYASSTVRALFLQALAAPSNDPDGWRNGEWSTVFDPSVAVLEATSTTVRLQVSLKNALRVDFSVDDVVVTCEYEGLEDEEDVVDCLSLDAPALMGQHRPAGVLRSSTSDMMDTIDGFTSYLAEGDMRPHDGHSPHPSKTADNDIAVTFGKIALPAQRGATADAMREHVPYGRYTCRQVAVRLADDVVLVVPLEDPVTFTLRPSYSSTMALDVRCPPILSPLTSTQCTVMIRPHGDIIQGGTLAVTIQGDAHVEISVASSTYARPNDSGGGGSVVVPLPSPCQVDTAFEFTLVSTSNKEECSHVVLDVAVHASITTKDGIAHKRTSRHAETHISVTPLVTTTTTTRCIRDTVHCVDIEIQANDKVGVEIDPAQYEWWALDHLHGGDAHDKEGHLVNLLSSDTPRYPGLLIMANPNTSLPVMTLNPSGRCHAAFVVDVTDELPSDTAVYMRLHCKSVWTADDSTVGTLDNPFPPLEMVTVVPMDVNLRLADLVFPRPFQLTTTCADLSTASTRSRWTTFSVDVVAPPSHSSQLWIGLDETSQRCWVCAGPSVQTVTSSSKAAFKLRPLHVGRLSFPVFTLKVRDSDNSVRIVAPNLVHQLPEYVQVLVLA